MTDVGRRSYLLLSLPAPVTDRNPIAPLQIDDAPKHNNVARRWWQERTLLNEKVRALQTLTLSKTERPTTAVLYVRAAEALQQCDTTLALWLDVFHTVYARGTSYVPEQLYITRWVTLAPVQDYTLYAFDDLPKARPTEKIHAMASLVFETVCMQYLRVALLQQCALFAHLVHQRDGGDDQVPDEPQVGNLLRTGITVTRELIEQVLPLHFATYNAQETFLISNHFHLHFVWRVLRAQIAYNGALSWHRGLDTDTDGDSARIDVCLASAALFSHSSRLVDAIRRTPYANQTLTGALAQYRLACSLSCMAQALHTADKCGLGKHVLKYVAGTPTSGDHCAALGVEAYVCARAAHALVITAKPFAQLYADITERAKQMHKLTVPADLGAPDARVAEEVRLTGGATTVPQLAQEFGHISITVKFRSNVRGAHANHVYPSLKVITLNRYEREFEIDYDGMQI